MGDPVSHARRGFTITGTHQSTIKADWCPNGYLHLHQGSEHIVVRPETVAAFKRAVAELGLIP